MTNKQEIRQRIRERLARIEETELKAQGLIASQNIAFLDEVIKAQTVMLYAPLADEPDVWRLIDVLLMKKKAVYLPVLHEGEIVPVEYCADDELLTNAYGILEPDLHFAQPKSTIDVVVVPGVAFDERGNRLGRGKGYYDKFLADLDAIKIGICFEEQVVPNVPHEQWDVAMDAVSTDRRLIRCNERVSRMSR